MNKLELAEIFWRLATLMEKGYTPAEALNQMAAELQQQGFEAAEGGK